MSQTISLSRCAGGGHLVIVVNDAKRGHQSILLDYAALLGKTPRDIYRDYPDDYVADMIVAVMLKAKEAPRAEYADIKQTVEAAVFDVAIPALPALVADAAKADA